MYSLSSRITLPTKRRALLATMPLIAAFGFGVLTASAAHAQANLTFTGGRGTPLTTTLIAPVNYTITSSVTNPYFDFVNVAASPFIFQNGSGTLQFSVNGGTRQNLDFYFSGGGSATNDRGANDLQIAQTYSSSLSTINAGDTVTLFTGSFTSNGNVAAAFPALGTFATYITDNNARRVSSISGAAAPEPGSIALLALAGLPALGALARRRRKAA